MKQANTLRRSMGRLKERSWLERQPSMKEGITTRPDLLSGKWMQA
eukprot:CAMPEP_0180532576 /NCGR_PEP_ID=MMETSP1036_2-20121128/63137_1 /TAXON_ID=632150 /ORGANISM="Azadinium spinosum, Strain 3D9" /LENGTH=44 /DNA_ID= /DNA_START= /DNA_END= /DNA_ORIENTATION=